MGTFQRQPATSSQIMAQVINEDKLQLQYVQNRYDLTEHKKIVTQLLTFFFGYSVCLAPFAFAFHLANMETNKFI